MPRYYMHLVDGSDELLDEDGVELPIDAVAESALLQARDCMAGDVKSGLLDLHYEIRVYSEAGEMVHCLKFSDAVEIVATA
jgi:hypothetical protein